MEQKKYWKWNREYIISNTLSDDMIREMGEDFRKLAEDEIFVRHPYYYDYYISQYGRCISLKKGIPHMIGACIGGQSDRQYLYYSLVRNRGNIPHTIGAHRAVADVFSPNFWGQRKKLEAHHLDGNRLNNNVSNLILVPTDLHAAMHKIKKIALLEDSKIIEYKNPLDLVHDTDLKLTLDDILMAEKNRKPIKKYSGSYTVYRVKGYLLGFKLKKQK